MSGRRAPGAGGGLRGRRIGGVIADVVEVDAAASRNCGGPACGCGRRCAEARLRWVAEIQHALGTEQFDQAFSAGAGLAQRDAVAIVRDQRGTSTRAS